VPADALFGGDYPEARARMAWAGKFDPHPLRLVRLGACLQTLPDFSK